MSKSTGDRDAILLVDHQWVFTPYPFLERQGCPWDVEKIERDTLQGVRDELEARFFIALFGERRDFRGPGGSRI